MTEISIRMIMITKIARTPYVGFGLGSGSIWPFMCTLYRMMEEESRETIIDAILVETDWKRGGSGSVGGTTVHFEQVYNTMQPHRATANVQHNKWDTFVHHALASYLSCRSSLAPPAAVSPLSPLTPSSNGSGGFILGAILLPSFNAWYPCD